MEAPSLARSRKLQEHIWELGGTLAPGMSLRLEVTLLAACLRGQSPKSESLSWLCLQSMCIEALLVTIRFLRTHWELQDLVRLEVQWTAYVGSASS